VYLSPTTVTATLQSPVPAVLQATPTTTWTFARDTFSGLDHLEGETVAILADGSPEVPQVVVNGIGHARAIRRASCTSGCRTSRILRRWT
jgi:hypothetical protein